MFSKRFAICDRGWWCMLFRKSNCSLDPCFSMPAFKRGGKREKSVDRQPKYVWSKNYTKFILSREHSIRWFMIGIKGSDPKTFASIQYPLLPLLCLIAFFFLPFFYFETVFFLCLQKETGWKWLAWSMEYEQMFDFDWLATNNTLSCFQVLDSRRIFSVWSGGMELFFVFQFPPHSLWIGKNKPFFFLFCFVLFFYIKYDSYYSFMYIGWLLSWFLIFCVYCVIFLEWIF